MRVRPGPVGPVSTVHTSTRRDATRRCMFQEVCPGAMVMHSGVVVGPVSSNFAYPAFIRSWPGGFICIRNSPDKNFRSSISLYFSGRETTECVLQLRDSKGDGISSWKKKGTKAVKEKYPSNSVHYSSILSILEIETRKQVKMSLCGLKST